jgi:hypothetical protein
VPTLSAYADSDHGKTNSKDNEKPHEKDRKGKDDKKDNDKDHEPKRCENPASEKYNKHCERD